ncbi:hypothetical protein [Saccharicrinis sp. GN24d3]|uniref:hypothetical protein n=1 Tax=Saccharicrinis sp. GN24d3 TaxID=3458416 RepID=UPI004036E239
MDEFRLIGSSIILKYAKYLLVVIIYDCDYFDQHDLSVYSNYWSYGTTFDIPSINLQYALEILLHIEITLKQDTSLHHFSSPERCYASFQ